MNISVETVPLTKHLNVKIYTLQNDFMKVKVMTYGGIVMEIIVPDNEGNLVDVALGFANPGDYLSNHYIDNCPYFGAIIGRYANRINNGKFNIVDHEYVLDQNNGSHHLHGGLTGFDKLIWGDEIIDHFGSTALRLFLTSNDGDQGYPGQVQVEVIYYLENGNRLGIDYRATTTQTTPINLTWHGYFNLSGEGRGHILDHELQINAPQYTEVNKDGIPTGKLIDVKDTPFDFTQTHSIGSRIQNVKGGYDHNYVRSSYGDISKIVAIVRSPLTGIKMTVWTTQPGIQLYTSNYLDATLVGKAGKPYGQYSGFCIETQHFPDSPNNPHFPKTLLEPGEVYQHSTIYSFDTK